MKLLVLSGVAVAALISVVFAAEIKTSAVVPTVFFLSRSSDPYRGTEQFKPTMKGIQSIVDAAEKALKLDLKANPQYFENIIILDEGDNWFVSFHARGNGNVQLVTDTGINSEASGHFLVNTNSGVYLSKASLSKVETPPASPILALPLISPAADGVKGLGTVIGVDE
ncbi:MAG TPA: hypothetical protein PLN52_24830 [Opitutaceae bacterium]|nr:hypothetical protein [Opitutaceae bacterium]